MEINTLAVVSLCISIFGGLGVFCSVVVFFVTMRGQIKIISETLTSLVEESPKDRKLMHETAGILKAAADTLKDMEEAHDRHERETLKFHAELNAKLKSD